MPSEFSWPGFAKLQDGLQTLQNFDATPLMERWEDIIVEGNRRGVLSGVDGFDNPAPPLQYRGGAGKPTGNRRVPNYGTTTHETTGFGPYATGLHDNLTTAQYRRLTGPRLAPRREQSRIIKNLHTRIDHNPSAGTWAVIGAWADVVSAKGVPFLEFHFKGMGRNPRYDLTEVRPQDLQFCLNALQSFMTKLFRDSF